MKKLLQIYKPLSIVEIALLCSILIHTVIVIVRRPSQYIDLFIIFSLFITPIIISWKIIALTTKGAKMNETLMIVGHIFNVLKLLALVFLIGCGLFFFSDTNGFMTFENERGTLYYLFFISFLLFIVVSVVSFISYFYIIKDNKQKIESIIKTIENLSI